MRFTIIKVPAFCVSTVMLVGCALPHHQTPPIPAEECAVLEDLIGALDAPKSDGDDRPAGFAANPVLDQTTTAYKGPPNPFHWSGPVTTRDLETFDAQSLPSANLRSCGQFLSQVRSYRNGVAAYLHETFSDGSHVSVSRVAFNRDHSLAALSYTAASGPLGLEVWDLILRRDASNHWSLVGWRLGLVS